MGRVLHSGTRNASSWAFRAWLALKEAGVAFEERVVDIRRPQRFENLRRIAEFSPAGGVPVLVDDDVIIFDSLAIMEYANDLGDGALLPRELRPRARVRSLLAWQHAGLSNLCAERSFESAFYPERPPMTADETREADRIYRAWEGELTASGGPYLAGALSLADLAFVPTVLRLPDRSAIAERWPRAFAWSERLLGRPAVREWLDEARTLPPVY